MSRRPRKIGGNNATLSGESEVDRRLRLYEAIVSATPDLVYVFDLDHRFVYANRALLEMWGKTWDEAIGRNCLELGYEPWHAEMHDHELQQVITTGQPVRGEVPFNGAGGRRIYDYIFTPVFGEDGLVEAVAGTTRDVTDRVQASAALADSEERHRSIVNQTVAGVAETDLEGRFRTVNEHLCHILGYQRDELLSVESIVSISDPNDAAEISDRLERLVATGESFDVEQRYIRKDGSVVWANAFVSPIRGSEGTINGIAAVVTDITSRKHIEHHLHAEVKFNQAVMDNMGEGLYTVDTSGNLVTMNRAAERLFRRSMDECRGMNMHNLMHYMHRDGSPYPIEECERREARAGRLISNAQDVFVRSDGSCFDAVYTAAPLITSGEITGTVVVFHDATDEIMARELLRESEGRFRQMADSSPTLVWMSDTEMRGTYFNRTWLEYTGRSLEDEIGNGSRGDVHLDDVADLLETFKAAFGSRSQFECEYRLRRHDGVFRWMLGRGLPLVTGDGQFLGYIGSCTDIDDIKRVEAALRESEERIRIAVDAARLVTWEWDLEHDLIHWTDRSMSVMGETTLSNPSTSAEFFEVLHVDDVDGVRSRILGTASAGEAIDFEFRTKRPDGSYRWISAYGQITRTQGDRPIRLSGVAADVTERKQALEDLRRQALLIELSQEPIFVWDLNGGIVEWNHGAEMLYGYTRQEAVGRYSHELLQTADPQSHEDYLKELERSQRWSGELRHIAKDGTEIIVETRHEVIESGGRRLVLETNRDITQRKFAERVLQRYRMLSERSRDAIWFVDADGNFIDVNQAAIDSYGYSREEFLSMNIVDVRQASTLGDVRQQLSEANMTGVSFETVHVRKDGTDLPVDVTANAADFDNTRVIMAIVRDISERKATENALKQSEARSKLAQEAGRVGIWDWDRFENRTYWSSSMWQIYGEQPSELDPDENYWSSHLHPADRERVVLHLRDTNRAGGDTFHDEFRIIKNDGSVGWIESTATIVRGPDGRAIRMYGVNIEITERKDAQDRIRLSENQLRLITNALPALIAYVDTSERYRYANSRFNEWFDIPVDEIIGKSVREVLGSSAYQTIKPWIVKALAGEKSTFETVLKYKNVGPRYVNISYVPDVGVEGTVHGYYALTHDLTDLKRSEDLLRTSEARLGMMMENLTDYAIFSLDLEGRIDSWNTGAEMIFGFSRDEAIGLDIATLFTPEDRAANASAKELAQARTVGKASDERWHIRKDGSRFFASGLTIPLYVGDKLTGYAKIATDLTERRRHAEELQRAHDELELRVQERTKELAHANAALLAEMEVREDSERQRADLLGRLVTSQEVERRRIARDLHDHLGQRLTALRLKIESLRSLSEPYADISARVVRLQEISEQLDSEVSFLAWELRPTALDDLGLEDAIGAFVSEWSRHFEVAAEFHSDGLSQVRLGHDVETHLYRITQEALNNIVKHAEASRVTVMLEKRGSNVMLIIEDDGAGFEPTDEKLAAGSSGGLGLVGMRERAILVGGTLEIESAPDQGTTLFVRVPVR